MKPSLSKSKNSAAGAGGLDDVAHLEVAQAVLELDAGGLGDVGELREGGWVGRQDRPGEQRAMQSGGVEPSEAGGHGCHWGWVWVADGGGVGGVAACQGAPRSIHCTIVLISSGLSGLPWSGGGMGLSLVPRALA